MAAVGGEIGEAHVTLRVEMARYEADLARARASANTTSNQIATSFETTSRRGRASFQNLGFQVQDFFVQVQGGQGVLRAFIQQGSQALSAFGGIGVAAGIAVTVLGTLAGALLGASSASGDAAESSQRLKDALDALDETYAGSLRTLDDVIERYRELTAQQRDLERASVQRGLEAITEQLRVQEQAVRDTADEFERLAELQRVFGRDTGLLATEPIISDEALASMRVLREELDAGRITAEEFSLKVREITVGELGAAEASDRLREFDSALGQSVQNLDRLRTEATEAQDRLALLESGAAGAAQTTREQTDAERGRSASLHDTGRATDVLRDKIRALETEIEIVKADPLSELGKQMRDVADVARTLQLTPEELAVAPADVRELAQAYIDLQVQLRELQVANEGAIAAESARLAQLAREHEALSASFDQNRLPGGEAGVTPEIDRRLESGGRLPDRIDAANIAAQELSATLVDINNLSFESLAAAFGDITQQIIQAIIQALIFRAITGAIGGAGGAAGASAGSAAVAGAHGLVISQGRILRMARGGFITDRPMLMPMASGAALIGEAGPEAVLPLKRMASGDLGVATDGGYGRGGGSTINIDARQSQPGTVATAVNLASRIAPGAVVNAQARGMTRSNRPPF